ncbi:DUF4238 domain-containing protein [Arthrobacter cryoconiti]|nr:DUF4238 domain-containing protein [Arthrobacter cryoconiti]
MSAMTIRQHYVSRALIARFSNSPELKNGLVGQFDVVNGRCMRAVSPRSIGFESYFIKYDGDRMEELWGTVERPMGEVFNALRDDPSDLLQAKQSHIKDFMALHFARSLEAQRIHIETLLKPRRELGPIRRCRPGLPG